MRDMKRFSLKDQILTKSQRTLQQSYNARMLEKKERIKMNNGNNNLEPMERSEHCLPTLEMYGI